MDFYLLNGSSYLSVDGCRCATAKTVACGAHHFVCTVNVCVNVQLHVFPNLQLNLQLNLQIIV